MERLERAFDPALRRAVAALLLAGTLLTVYGAALAYAHPDGGPWIAFVPPGIALPILAAATLRGDRWALALDAAFLAAQLAGVAGVLFELSHFDTSEKAAQVRALGGDPLFGLLTNLAFSAIGAALFARIAWRSL